MKIKNSTRILISFAVFIVATILFIGAIIGVHSIHLNKTTQFGYQIVDLPMQTTVDVTNRSM